MKHSGHIAILGAGNMGTALGHLLASNGHEVVLWDFFTEVVEEINLRHRNSRYLDGVELSKRIRATSSRIECVQDAAMLVLAMPSAFIVDALLEVKPVLSSKIPVISAAKGVLRDTHEPISEKIAEVVASDQLTILGGPAIANEFSRGMATAVMLASVSSEQCALWQGALQNDFFRTLPTQDVTGVYLGGILKNVYAILLGYLDALGGGKNLEAAVLNAALREMAMLAIAKSAQRETIYGLAGLGDLVATGFSKDSHNRGYGWKLGSNSGLSETKLLPEGAWAVHSVCLWANEAKVEVPLACLVKEIVEGKRPGLAEALRFI
ncbi:MAG TPA: NAD(P)H-dependent glycerol-3-phosphate dehydrogenase [Verrucomicrobiae bacterium]